MNAKISVIMPAYNAEKTIEASLDSLLAQTLQDIQVIVVDDGSTDNTSLKIKEYKDKFQDLTYILKENGGVSSARNAGLRVAKGKYIAFLDDDDILSETSLQDLYVRAESKGADLVMGRVQAFNNLGSQSMHTKSETLANKGKIDPFDKDMLWSFLIGNKLYRRSLIEEYNLTFPEMNFSEDGVFFMQFVYKTGTNKIYGCSTSLYRYRIVLGDTDYSVSRNMSVQNIEDCIASYRMVYDMAIKNEVLSKRGDDERSEYLAEHAYKTCNTMIAQFYRKFWQMNDACTAIVVDNFMEWKEKITSTQFEELRIFNHDLDLNNLLVSHKEMAKQPLVSVVAENNSASVKENQSFFNSLFNQSMPAIQIVTTQEMADNGSIQDFWLKKENLTLVDGTGTKNDLKKAVLAPRVIYFKKPEILAEGAVRAIHRSGKSHIFGGKFFSPIAKVAMKLFGRR